MPAAQTGQDDPQASSRPRVCATGSPVSLRDLLERVDLQQLIGDHPLQLPVLTLQLLQPLRAGGLQPAIPLTPATQRLLRHLEPPRNHGDLPAIPEQPVSLAQLPDDLLRRMPAPPPLTHRSDCPPCPSLGSNTLAATDRRQGVTPLRVAGGKMTPWIPNSGNIFRRRSSPRRTPTAASPRVPSFECGR